MEFLNQSKSLLPISRKTLEDMCIKFGKNPKDLTNRGKVNEANYPDYVREITGYSPCPICNGPRGYVKLGESRVHRMLYLTRMFDFQTKAIYSPIRCLQYPVHSIIQRSKDPLANWERNTRNLCDHGFYFVECKECHQNLEEVKHGLEMVPTEA